MDDDVKEVLAALRREAFFWRAKQATKDQLLRPLEDATSGTEREAVERAFAASGFRDKVKAFAFLRLRSMRPGTQDSPSVDWARRQWSELLLQRLQKLSQEQRQPFLRRRPKPLTSEDNPGKPREEEVSTRHIVDLNSLYNLITRDLRTRLARDSSNRPGAMPALGSEMSGIHLRSLEELRLRYGELAPGYGHLGVPELPEARDARAEAAKLEMKRRRLGQKLLVNAYPAELQILARFGVSPSLRREVWGACLGAKHGAALQEAARGICEWEWLTDDVLRLDVAEHCANDVSYFPFDELVEALVLALSRDPQVSKLCESGSPQIPIVVGEAVAQRGPALSEAVVKDTAGEGEQFLPPSGVVPFKGFSNYACPFAFLSDRLETAYPLFRGFYCRHLSRLHSISGQAETLVTLCGLFEQLTAQAAPRAVQHLLALDTSPLRYAFHWIVTGFVGCLPAEQILHLWDRVLGFDSVELVPVLAAAVFALRARLVLAARRQEEVQLLFADVSCVKAIPLLQAFLFGSDLGVDPWDLFREVNGQIPDGRSTVLKEHHVGSVGFWSRSFSASDVVAMRRTPTRRVIDSRQPPEELLSPKSTMEVLTPKATLDPANRRSRLHYTCRIEDGFSPTNFLPSVTTPGTKSRALDDWRVGEGSRIMNYLQPKKYRPMSLYGEAFQGKWNTDWHDVSHISALRQKYPWARESIELKALPHPEGPNAQEIRRNRNFGPSHGADKCVRGMIRCGSLCMIP
ncbi:unnamed protein product [Effrenium voratum]|uniref:Rab-GAP TBC domain-containing protein n=1 Tax=Effrenium voratum TaxID=2562239 RepID=A0AA36N2W7_9DINO|nr:unnamed protein product [Effrenium voratum]